ncbi:hypothetical protein [Neobacillus sp. FSL H8-0543]|uniref:hypothetical protein n=1 Tax=Neobacillus sp. FSL H8-0543 TaxID=2954672 RepID=UPI00315928AF
MERDQLIEELKQILIREIPNAVRNIRLDEEDKVCYLSLLGTDYEPVLGLITVGIESFRKKIIEEYGIEDKYSIWNSGEMPVEYQTGIDNNSSFLKKQEALVELFGDEEWEESWEACQTLRFEVAKELNTFNWNEILPLTEDFVVYSDWEAIDVSNGDLLRSVPKEKIEILINKGLI